MVEELEDRCGNETLPDAKGSQRHWRLKSPVQEIDDVAPILGPYPPKPFMVSGIVCFVIKFLVVPFHGRNKLRFTIPYDGPKVSVTKRKK